MFSQTRAQLYWFAKYYESQKQLFHEVLLMIYVHSLNFH